MKRIPQKRRIVRTGMLLVAVPVLLIWGYFGAYVGMHLLLGRGMLPVATYCRLTDTLFAPAVMFSQSGLPGAYTVRETSRYFNFQGTAPYGSGTLKNLNNPPFQSPFND